jgi:hypothetical protein
MTRRIFLVAIATLLLFTAPAAADYKAGVAKVVITPELGLWMAGYASRNKPAEGKTHELWAKAVALEDAGGGRLVIVTTDLIGLTKEVSDTVAAEVARTTKLPRERLVLSASHTHCGPVIRGNLEDMYNLDEEQRTKLMAYRRDLEKKLAKLVADAVADLKPAKLSIGYGMAGFAINRRQKTEKGFVIGTNPDGPVDHRVPVMAIHDGEGKALRAVLFGYACHNTTLSFYDWCGDYAGFAQHYIEKDHPGTVALFWTGCGADANPHPRGKLDLADKHGKELADGVASALKGKMKPVAAGKLQAGYATIAVPFGELPTKEKLQADLLSKTFAVKTRAARLLKQLEQTGKLDGEYAHYPVQVVRIGQVAWVCLGGEVCIDYALRLTKELGKQEPDLWVMGYANDVMAYIPSVRVLEEGGYEADSSMIYYGMPTKWAPAIENKIIAKVHELLKAAK